jgi:hypothetical protein
MARPSIENLFGRPILGRPGGWLSVREGLFKSSPTLLTGLKDMTYSRVHTTRTSGVFEIKTRNGSYPYLKKSIFRKRILQILIPSATPSPRIKVYESPVQLYRTDVLNSSANPLLCTPSTGV